MGRFAVALLIVTFFYFAVMNIPFLYDMVGYRLELMISGLLGGGAVDASTSTRMGLVEHGINFFLSSPWIGHGGANFAALNAFYYRANAGCYAHNNFIEILADYGVIGFILYYWIYIFMIAKTIKRLKTTSNLQLMVFSLLVTLLIMEYGFVSYYDRFFQAFLAFAFCVLVVFPPNGLPHLCSNGESRIERGAHD